MSMMELLHPSSASPDSDQDFHSILEAYIPQEVRSFIETEFYHRVSEQAKLEHIRQDTEFLKSPLRHIALYTDHGVVHVRDVATQVLEVVKRVDGKLIPKRKKSDLDFMKAYLVQLAYLHDIGMADFSAFGRFMHPEFAAQFVYSAKFSTMFDVLWAKNAGNLPRILLAMFNDQHSELQVKTIYRELLALSVAHSKSKVPIHIVNAPTALRERLIYILNRPLQLLFYEQKIRRLQQKLENAKGEKKQASLHKEVRAFEVKIDRFFEENPGSNAILKPHYGDVEKEGFLWLNSTKGKSKRLIINVLDSLRCLRVADALRQRGTTLRTSAGYEIYVDRQTANAIYALRSESNDRLYLLEGKKTINAGEANVASSELDAFGHLRIAFHLGAFRNVKTTKKAARNLATVIDDIQADSVQSFLRDPDLDEGIFSPPAVAFEDISILLEATDDNPNFAELVCKALKEENPDIAHRIRVSFSLHGFDLDEIKRYLDGTPLTCYLDEHGLSALFMEKLQLLNYPFAADEIFPGEEDIRVIQLTRGDQLIKGGTKSGFVYFPIGEGLRVYPLGGYESRDASAWVPLGNTGVIRGSVRNAHVIAEKPVALVCIPKEVYLNQWYRPLSPKDLLKAWKREEV